MDDDADQQACGVDRKSECGWWLMIKDFSQDKQYDVTKEIVYLIRRLMQAGEKYTKELNKKHNVSAPQLACLITLFENGSLPPSQIAKNILVNSSTVTGIIDRLEQKGLAKRERKSKDRRVVTVELTEPGMTLAKNAPSPIQQKIIDGLQQLPDEDIQKIISSLTKLTEMLDVDDLPVEEIGEEAPL